MNKIYFGLVAAGFLTACAEAPVEADHAFGESVAQMVTEQTLDPAAAEQNGDVASKDGEGRRLENVLEGYRTDNARGVEDVKRDVRITVGN